MRLQGVLRKAAGGLLAFGLVSTGHAEQKLALVSATTNTRM